MEGYRKYLERADPHSLGLCLLSLSSCSRSEVACGGCPGGGSAARRAVAARRGRPGDRCHRHRERSLPVILRAVGNVESSSTVEMRSQVTGSLLTVEFREGQDVAAGDLLFTIDPRPFDVALKQAEAQLAKDAGQSKNAEVQRARYADLASAASSRSRTSTPSTRRPTRSCRRWPLDNVQIENARLQLQYTKIRLADQRPDRRAAGASWRPDSHQRRDADGGDQSADARFRELRRCRRVCCPACARDAARTAGCRLQATVAGSQGPSIRAGRSISSTTRSTRGPTRSASRRHSRTATTSSGRASSLKSRLRVAEDAHAIVVPAVAVQPGQQGTFVWVINADQTAAVRPVTVARTEGEQSVIAERPEGRRSRRHRRPASLTAGAPRVREARRPRLIVSIAHGFIKRPVATTLLQVAIIIFGVVGYRSLPVADLPTVDFPTIQVERQPARRESRNNGGSGGDAARKTVRVDRRHLVDQLVEHPGQHQHHAAVRSRSHHRRGRPGRAGGDCQDRAPAPARHAVAAVVPEGQPGRSAGDLPDAQLDDAAACRRSTSTRRR